MSCFDLTHAPVAIAARAAATGLVSMSTRPDPGSVRISAGCLPHTGATAREHHSLACCGARTYILFRLL